MSYDPVTYAREKAHFAAELERRIPAGFKGVVIAELREDDSDSMSDYWGHNNTRSVVIGFTKTSRNNFNNMRKAAAKFAPTADLATAGKDAEHRENYSMGGGYYLKAGNRHSDGWAIKILDVKYATTNPMEFSPELRSWSISLEGLSPAPEPAPHATVSAELAEAFGMKAVPEVIEIKPITKESERAADEALLPTAKKLWAAHPNNPKNKPAIEPDLEAEHRRETTQEVLAEFPTFYVNADEPQPEREYDPDFELDEPDPKFLP